MVLSSSGYGSRLYAASIVLLATGIYSLLMSIPLDNSEAQDSTNQTTDNIQKINMTSRAPIPLDCATVASGTITENTSDAVIDIRCSLEEARHAIAADAADSALQQINEADNVLVTVFGNNSALSNSSSNGIP